MEGEDSRKQPDFDIPACSAKDEGLLDDASDDENIQSNRVGFERGLGADCIVGVTKNSNGELVYLMKWKGSSLKDFVLAHVANERWPHLVISYYESIIKWKNLSPEEEERRRRAIL